MSYIGSALVRNPVRRLEVQRKFGKEARYLIVEALLDEGVVVSPLVKYIDYNMRVCRPYGLTKEQLDENFRAAAEAEMKGARGHGQNDFKIELAKRTLVRALSDLAGGAA